MTEIQNAQAEERGIDKKKAIAGVALLALAAGTVGYALYAVYGEGVGTANSSSVQNLIVDAELVGDPLNPGETGDVEVTVTNPNEFHVEITEVEIKDGDDTTGGGVYSEANGDFSDVIVESGATSSGTLEDAVTLNADVTDPNAVFTYPVTVTGIQYTGTIEDTTTVVVGDNWSEAGGGSIVVDGDYVIIDGSANYASYSGYVWQLTGIQVSDIEDITYTVETVSGATAARVQFAVMDGLNYKLVSMDFPPATAGEETISLTDATITVHEDGFVGTFAEFQAAYGHTYLHAEVIVQSEGSVNKVDEITFDTTDGKYVIDFQA